MEYELAIFATENGKEPFHIWLKSLKNVDTQSLIFQRLQRIRLGNFGDCKPIAEGLWELRIHSKSSLRVYYARIGRRLLLIIGGGDKGSQRRDINQAMSYLKEYKKRIQ